MTIIILLIAISLSIALLFLAIFFWNMRSGQYDDTYTPSVRMLFDDKSGAGKEISRKETPDHTAVAPQRQNKPTGVVKPIPPVKQAGK